MTSLKKSSSGTVDALVSYNVIYSSPLNEPEPVVRPAGKFPFEYGPNPLDPAPTPPPKYIEITDARPQQTHILDPQSEFDELSFQMFQSSYESEMLNQSKDGFYLRDGNVDFSYVTEVGPQSGKHKSRVISDLYQPTFINSPSTCSRVVVAFRHFPSQDQRCTPIQEIPAVIGEAEDSESNEALLYTLDLYAVPPHMSLDTYRPMHTDTPLQDFDINGYIYQINVADDNFLLIYPEPTVIVPNMHQLTIPNSAEMKSEVWTTNSEQLTIPNSTEMKKVGTTDSESDKLKTKGLHDTRKTNFRKTDISKRASIHFVEEYPSFVANFRSSSHRTAVFKKIARVLTPTYEANGVPLSQYTDTLDSTLDICDAEYDRINERLVIFYKVHKTGADVEVKKEGNEDERGTWGAPVSSQPAGAIVPEPTYKELMSALCRPGVIHAWMQASEKASLKPVQKGEVYMEGF
jgi:hypothetical protein